jgi:hypothetical protein
MVDTEIKVADHGDERGIAGIPHRVLRMAEAS